MGLAAVKNRQKLGFDPRNTNWSNDTSRFGHKHLEQMGWKPGSGLGLMPNSTTSHVKVSIKDDNLGLGAKLRKKQKTDEFDSGECAGLDAFQRLLGRLNGKEETVSNELDTQKRDNIINGKWGIHFVKGDVLASTWDAKTKTLKLYSNELAKRSRSDEDDEQCKSSKKSKKNKRDKKDKKDKKTRSSEKKDQLVHSSSDNEAETKSRKDKKDKKNKKEKKVKKAKQEKKSKSREDKKRDKSSRGSKSEEITRDAMLKPKSESNDNIVSRLSVRSKWIKQKRAAVMDAKALNEIFMIAS